VVLLFVQNQATSFLTGFLVEVTGVFNSTEPGPVQVIQYEGDNSTFVWKSPIEDFNTLSQLIVHESQEAVLFMDGQALDLFGPGRHTLETQNIPLLSRLLNLVGGGCQSVPLRGLLC
jgi:hypothetical protein